MPSTSEKQRRFFGAELARRRAGRATKTTMSEHELVKFASEPITGGKKPSGKKPKKKK